MIRQNNQPPTHRPYRYIHTCLNKDVVPLQTVLYFLLSSLHPVGSHQSACEKGDSPMLPNNPNHDTDTRPMAFRSASRGTGKEQYPSQLEELVICLLLLSLEGRLLYDDNTDGERLYLPMTVKLHTAFFTTFLRRRRVGRDHARKLAGGR